MSRILLQFIPNEMGSNYLMVIHKLVVSEVIYGNDKINIPIQRNVSVHLIPFLHCTAQGNLFQQ